jgi:hypothetical protein
MLGKLYEEFYLLSYDKWSIGNRLMSRRNKSPPFPGSKHQLHAGFFLGLFFALEDGGDVFPRYNG